LAQHNPARQPGAAHAQPVGPSSYPDLRAPQRAIREITYMGESWLISPSTIHFCSS